MTARSIEARDVDAVVRRDARRCAAPTSPWTRGRDRSPSWARAAPASRRCCTAWPASSCRDRARSGSTAGGSTRSSETERSALRRDRFGFVFQFGQLVPELTAEENVALPLLLGGHAPGGGAAPRPRGWFEPARPGRAWSGAARASCPAARPSGSRWPAGWSPARGAVRRRADRLAGLAHRRARDGPAGRQPPASRAPRSSSSPTSRGSPPTPTARSSSATAGSRPLTGRVAVVIRFGLRLAAARRPRGGGPPGRHRRRRRARRRPAAGHARRGQRGRRPERPLRLAELRHARGDRARRRSGADPLLVARSRPTASHGTRSSAVDVAATGADSPVPPGLSRSCPARASSTPRPRWPQLLARHPGRRARRPLPRPPVGTIGDAALPSPDSLIVVVGRTADRAVAACPAPPRSRRSPRTSPGDCRALPRRHGRQRHRPRPVGRDRRGPALPGADPHRHGDPAVAPPAASSASPRCGWSAPRPARSRWSPRSSPRSPPSPGTAARLRAVRRWSAAPLAAVPLTGEPFFPGDLVADAARRPRSSRLGVPVAALPRGAGRAAAGCGSRPLGVSRRVTPRPPRAYRLLPLPPAWPS